MRTSLGSSLDSSSKKRSIVAKLLCPRSKHPTADNLLDCPSFEELAQERKFDSICEILSDPATPTEWLACYSSRSTTPLHLLCPHQPTAAVVQKTLEILWTCDLQVDAQGRTPLHLAVQHGVQASVVRALLGDDFSTAAGVQDLQQRYPLHCAVCEGQQKVCSGKKMISNKKRQAAADNLAHTVQLLLETYPDALLEPDAQGRTPLDLARTASKSSKAADPRILASLEFAAKMLDFERKHHNFIDNDAIIDVPKRAPAKSQAEHSATTASSTEFTDHPHPHDDDDDKHGNWLAAEQQEWLPLQEVAPQAVLQGDDDDDLSSIGLRDASRHPRKQRSLFKYVCVDL